MTRLFTSLLLVFLAASVSLAQSAFRIDSLPAQGVLLDKGWKWHAGDNPDWAKPEFDDTKWDGIDPTTEIAYLPQVQQAEIGWFRLHLSVSPAVLNQSLAVMIGQVGASEIYLDGQLIYRFGVVSADYAHEQTYYLENHPFALKLDPQVNQTLAVRYSFNRKNFYVNYTRTNPVIRLTVKPSNNAFSDYVTTDRFRFGQPLILATLYLLLGLMYLVLYGSFRAEKAYLWIGIYSGGMLLAYSCSLLTNYSTSTYHVNTLLYITHPIIVSASLALLHGLHILFRQAKGWFWWTQVGYGLFAIPAIFWSYRWGATLVLCFYLLVNTGTLLLILHGIRQRRAGSWVLLGIALVFSPFFSAYVWFTALKQYELGSYCSTIAVFSIPIGYAIFLAGEFARTSRSLQERVVEVEALSAQTIAQEQEKQQLLATQNERLEQQVTERTAELNAKNEELVVEAALERVRTQSMAMQQSDQLQEVIHVISEQLQALGFQFDFVNFVLIMNEEGWHMHNASTDETGSFPFYVPYLDHKIFNWFADAARNGTEFYTYSLTHEEKNSFFKHLFENTSLKDVPEEFKQDRYNRKCLSASVAHLNKNLSLSLGNFQGVPYTDGENAIFRRFGAVFGQAYTRFLDLQKAEVQAREAIRTASLDRVRAQIASMRTTQDLTRIPPLIWNELNTLGVPFIRCGVFIIDEQQEQIHTFLSSPDGKAIASFTTSFSNPGLLAQALPHWRAKQIYTTHWDEAALLAQAQTLISQGVIASPETYLTDQRPTSLYLHLLPFMQGMLYVGNDTSPLTDDQLSVVQTLADAFSTAYARYEDFTKLEAAKKLAESTLNELKVTQTQLIQKEKMASLGELTAGIAHEIQNPLNFVNNFSEVSTELVAELEEEQHKPDRDADLEAELLGDLKQNLQKITLHGGRASAIVKGMLEHSRSSTGEKRPTDLNVLAEEYLKIAYHGQRSKDKDFNTDLTTDFQPEFSKVDVIPQEIGRVLVNLFNNAFYAVQQKHKTASAHYQPSVSITTKQTATQVEIRVKDNGVGIPESVKAKIFQPFFTTKPTGEGTGLGLSLSYDIITKGHQGSLVVQSQEGEGTEFVIQLPMAKVISARDYDIADIFDFTRPT